MAANVLDVRRGIEVAFDDRAPLPCKQAHRSTSRLVRRWSFVGIGSAMVGASALALQLIQPATSSSDPAVADIPPPASIYFETAQAVVGDDGFESIMVIARAARTSPMPVAVTPFAGPRGSLEQSAVLANQRARRVREALVLAGVPRVRIIIVSPTFVANESPRVEVSLVPGVRIFPTQADASLSLSR